MCTYKYNIHNSEEGSRMAYISSNYVYILFVCASALISSECEIQQKNDAFYFKRSKTSSEWKLFRFDKMEVNSFQILLVDVTFYL